MVRGFSKTCHRKPLTNALSKNTWQTVVSLNGRDFQLRERISHLRGIRYFSVSSGDRWKLFLNAFLLLSRKGKITTKR